MKGPQEYCPNLGGNAGFQPALELRRLGALRRRGSSAVR
jgi:hypothetical protein